VLPSIGFTLPSGTKTDIWSTDIRSTDLRSTELRSIATPHVVGEAGRRFCIAVPLRTADGFDLGTLCVMDSQPIPVDARRIRQLETLAAIVMDQLEVRLASRRAAAQAVIMAGENDHRTMNSLQFVASLLNLQSRAVRSTEPAGQLTHGAGNIKVTFRIAGRGEYGLCVLDEGKGLPAGFAPDRHSAGGLGIKLVALLVSQFDGQLSVGANPAGRGACFTVTFPHG
jgi:hypothetical protein